MESIITTEQSSSTINSAALLSSLVRHLNLNIPAFRAVSSTDYFKKFINDSDEGFSIGLAFIQDYTRASDSLDDEVLTKSLEFLVANDKLDIVKELNINSTVWSTRGDF